MRFLSAMCVLWVTSDALGQITVTSTHKRVEAFALVECHRPGNPFSFRENPIFTEGNPLLAQADIDEVFNTPVGAQIESWQDVATGVRSIIAAGGVRGAARYGNANSVGSPCQSRILGRSNVDIEFTLDRSAAVSVTADIINPPSQHDGLLADLQILSGEIFYSLADMRGDYPRVFVETPRMELMPAEVQRTTDARTLPAGAYTLSITAQLFDDPFAASQSVSFRDISYDVRLDVVHVPEPATGLLALAPVMWLTKSLRRGFPVNRRC